MKRTRLYPTDGITQLIADFVGDHIEVLEKHEQEIIQSSLGFFPKEIPRYLSSPLSVIKPRTEPKTIARVSSVGSRSVYWEEKGLKLKGCKPRPDLHFPHEQLEFGATAMTTSAIRFGCLSEENVMREILAFCFLRKYSLPVFQKPQWVMEYHHNGSVIGHCLVSHSPSEERIEKKEDFFGLTIRELIILSRLQRESGIKLLKDQTGFKGVDDRWYNKRKAALLVAMNFHGGFRGILNSNLGNDIVYKKRFYICDFDTFKVVQMPKKAKTDFIRYFCLWSVAETLKSSPLVLDYVDLGNKKYGAEKLWDIYAQKSGLWRSYYKNISHLARQAGWSPTVVDREIKGAISSGAIKELILDNILNSRVLKKTYRPEHSFYIPHNY